MADDAFAFFEAGEHWVVVGTCWTELDLPSLKLSTALGHVDDLARASIENCRAWYGKDVASCGCGEFHLHEHAVVYGYDDDRGGFLVDHVLSGDAGPFASWDDWPSKLGLLELFAPVRAAEMDPVEAIAGALETALSCFAGGDGPDDGQARGTAALDAWATAMDAQTEVDRAGNAYTLAVLQTARLDGYAFLADVAEALPDIARPLNQAITALKAETQALSPLLTLFPFPSGGHGNVANAGLRRGAAMALRRAAEHERTAAAAITEALTGFE